MFAFSFADRFDMCEANVYRRICRVIVTHFMDVFLQFPTGQATVLHVALRSFATSAFSNPFLKKQSDHE